MELLREYNDIFQNIDVKIPVLKKEDNGRFMKKELHFTKVMENLDQVATIYDRDRYYVYKPIQLRIDLNRVKMLLKQKKIPFSIIILNFDFSELLEAGNCESVMISTLTKSDTL